MITGGIQAALPASPPAAAARGLSVRDTPIASKPLNACSDRVAPTFAVRLAYYKREPLAQLNPPGPGRGPNATAGSPSDAKPFSAYQGRVPIGPVTGVHGGSSGPTTPRQPRPVRPVYVGCVHDVPPSNEK